MLQLHHVAVPHLLADLLLKLARVDADLVGACVEELAESGHGLGLVARDALLLELRPERLLCRVVLLRTHQEGRLVVINMPIVGVRVDGGLRVGEALRGDGADAVRVKHDRVAQTEELRHQGEAIAAWGSLGPSLQPPS